ncbi:unnamed protein product [Cochlearia groenlandica]
MFSGFSPTMLSLEMPQQNTVQFQHPHPYQPTTVDNHQPPPSTKPLYPLPSSSSKPKLSPISFDDEEEDRVSGSGSGCNPEEDGQNKRSLSQWHRIKWTDTMVRLLIMAVFYIGDEASLTTDPIESKRKLNGGGSCGGGGGGMLQKKGKWRSVSRAMVEKGFSVSPQQCEDKFNDLNKRYKRVNDILGKGTACQVVENHDLLETMSHHILTPKLKDEVKKLLNSKHLFFREMCAYHNSCGHLGGHNAAVDQQPNPPQQIHQNPILTRIAESEEREGEESDMAEDSESEESEEEEEAGTRKKRRRIENVSTKRIREEAARVTEDAGRSAWEKKEWMKRKLLEIEEKKVGLEWEAVEIEKQRVKWMRYRSKKERDMEKAKLENQRRRLETERMVLILRRSEIEMTTELKGKRVDPSLSTG